MTYHVAFTEKAIKQTKKYHKGDIQEIMSLVKESLSENPTNRGKFFGRSVYTNLLYYEKRLYRDGGLRFYYTIQEGTIIVSEIEYDGRVNVEGMSKKQNQKNVTRGLGL